MRQPSRRAVLLGGLAVVTVGGAASGYELVQTGVLPGKYTLARLDGACGSPPPSPAGALPIQRDTTFYSAFRRKDVTMATLIPAGVSPAQVLGVVVALHGAFSDARSFASQLAPAMTAAKIGRLAVVAADGGNTYWHKRADGDDPAGMIIHEVLPRLAAAGLPTAQIAIIGESMGGYGALLIAEQMAGRKPTVRAVAALSPAIFANYADAVAANRTSFDNAADFARHDVLARVGALREVPTWVGVGADDPFEVAANEVRARLAAITGHQAPGGVLPGCHDDAFFARNMPSALVFAARSLP